MYQGCFRDMRNDRDLDASLPNSQDLTAEGCAATCASSGYKFFGLQYSIECWCGNDGGSHGAIDEEECLFPCSGDPSTACGGGFAISLYLIRPEFIASKCSLGCNPLTCTQTRPLPMRRPRHLPQRLLPSPHLRKTLTP